MSRLHGGLPPGSRRRAIRAARGLALAACAAAVSSAWAQAPAVSVTAGLSASQVFTDNRDLSDSDPQADAITVVSPSLRVSARGGRTQLSLDYSLNGFIYARDGSANNLQNALSAQLASELVPQHLSVTAQAAISQQSVSALQGFAEPQLGTGAGGGGLGGGLSPGVDRNRAEVRTLGVSPTLRGRPFGTLDFQLSAGIDYADRSGGSEGDATRQQLAFSLGDSSRTLGWGLAGSRAVNDFRGGRKTTSDDFGLRLSYRPQPELSLFATAGVQRNDAQTLDSRTTDTWGAGLSWTPGPRTQLSLQGNRQFFGDTWSFSASQRLRRAVFTYGDTRNVTDTVFDRRSAVSAYDLFFQQFASLQPDPVLRDVLVRDFLQSSGLSPGDTVNLGFLTQALSVQRSRNLGLSLLGRRTNVVLSAFATATRRLDRISTAADDLSTVDLLRQYGATLSISHRLSPSSAIVLSGGGQRTRSGSAATDGEIGFASLTWTGSVGPRTSTSLAARYASAGGVRPYDVSSLNATLNHRF